MGNPALLYSLATLILSTCCGVACVLVSWRWASRAIRQPKQPASAPATPISGELAQVKADQVELFASLEKITQTMKRLSSRAAVQDHRARRNGDDSSSQPPPVGASKNELRRFYVGGKNHIEIANYARDKVREESDKC